MNILILSSGTRNKIIQYFKQEKDIEDTIIAGDCSLMAPALYDADKFIITPALTDKDYLPKLIEICQRENIHAIMSLIDPELTYLSHHQEVFEKIGTQVIVSPASACELSLNKYEMFKWLKEAGFKTPLSYLSLDEFKEDYSKGKIHFPVFVKPYDGSASNSIQKVEHLEFLEKLMEENSGLMIQEFLDGEEIGADVYIDLISHELISIFTKKKLKMRAGETDKSISFIDEKLNAIIEDLVSKSGYIGPIDIDIFKINDDFYISEINPRFGGGYPHAYACGVNNMKYLMNNLKGITNQRSLNNYSENVLMMKYNEIAIKENFDEKYSTENI